MKTKEIRERIQALGFERGTVYCLEAMNEMTIQTRKDLAELAIHFDKLVDSMDGMLAVAGRMKEKIESFEKNDHDLDESTESLDKKH
jgi:hypothetical protein